MENLSGIDVMTITAKEGQLRWSELLKWWKEKLVHDPEAS